MTKAPTLLLAMLAAASCADAAPDTPTDLAAARSAARSTGNVVDITASGLTLDAPAEIPAGWTTFRLHNRSGMTHFAVLERLPDGKTLADSEAEVVPVFQDAMDLINAGNPADGFAEFARLPAWYFEVVFFGGPGFIAPGGTAQTSVNLEPGIYVIECYVKSGGRFHSADGMIEQIVVTEQGSGAREPSADVTVALSDAGIALGGTPRPGLQTFRVEFDEQRAHENFLGTDVHLARLADGTDMAALETWMNWVEVEGLDTPAPVEFLGGIHEMPAGEAGYFTALLRPGEYALIAEVPNPGDKGLLVTFSVPAARNR